MNRKVLIAATLTLLIVFIVRWWIPTERVVRSVPALKNTDLDYTLTDFKSEFFNSDGVLEWVIESPKLTHDAQSRTARIESPLIEIDPTVSQWFASANEGYILRNEDELVLMGNVIIRQPVAEGERIIQTERLHHHRRQRTISTDDEVEIQMPDAIIQAGGVSIDLNTQTMEFFDHVQGEIFMDHPSSDLTLSDDIRPRG